MKGLRARVAQLPAAPRERAARLFRDARAIAMRGSDVTCPCCEGSFRTFLVNHNGRRALCPRCGSLERHRLLWLWLRQRVEGLPRPIRVLHVAPEPSIRARLLATSGVEYISVDMESPEAMVHADVTDLPFRDRRFDLVLCNHVLEHVIDDSAAVAELQRVTAMSGVALLQTPWDPAVPTTEEDPEEADPSERLRRFGQEDHVRRYGADFPDRLRAGGFVVELVPYARTLGPQAIQRLGLDAREEIVVCRPAPTAP